MENCLFWDKSILFLSFVSIIVHLFAHFFLNFLANETVRLLLELYVQKIIQINSRLKQNCKIAYCSLKNMSYRIEVLGDTKYRNLISFFEKMWIYRKRKAFVESILHQRFFPTLKGNLAKHFSKELSVSLAFAFIV